MNSDEKKNVTERLHIKYLAENLNVNPNLGAEGFDFSSDRHLLELKSRLCLFNKHGPTDNIWWALSEPQIRDYEEKYDSSEKGFLWMFVHAFTRDPCYQLKSEREIRKSIYRRDIFIAPWNIYKESPLGNEGRYTKTGPYRHVSRKNLLKRVIFKQTEIKEGRLYLPKGNELDYLLQN